MALPDREKEFIINEVGNVTKERYTGTFRVKRVLSQREKFVADLRRRSILGPSPETASMAVAESAYALGQLSVRVTKSPTWWNPNGEEVGGLDMLDENVLGRVFEEALKAELEWVKDLEELAGSKEGTVKETAEKKSPVLPDEQK